MNAGDNSSYAALSRVAQHAESLGYDSLWVAEREPFPLGVEPKHAVFTGELVVSRRGISCLHEALAVAAVQTDNIRLGISLPNIPFYSPIDTGHSLAALDRLSDGRIQLGLGLGWSVAEFQKVGAALAEPGTPANEFVRAIQTVWDDLGSGFVGDHYLIPKQGRGLAPIQRPHLPIQLVAFAPAAVQPPAQLLRGGAPLSMSLSSEEMADALVGVAGSTKQFTGSPEIVVRALVRLTEGPIGESRAMFTGSRDQLRDDIAFVHSLGVDELQFDLSQMQASYATTHMLDVAGKLRDLVPVAMRSVRTAFAQDGVAA